MIPSPFSSSSEEARLAALHDLRILDTQPEDRFDDLTQLAASICGAPVALISLVDAHRQWFMAKHGTDVCETPRDISFCGVAIQDCGSVFIVPNTLEDPRFAANPLVTGPPYIRFYAGAPLVTEDGHALGTLCVIDMIPRQLTTEQRSFLEVLARRAVQQIALRRNIQTLEEKLVDMWTVEAALRDSEIRKAAVVDCALDAIVTIDADSRIVEWNRAAERTFGYTREEAIGHDMGELIVPKAMREAHHEGVQRFLRTHSSHILDQRIEITAVRKNGTEFPIELTATAVMLQGQTIFMAYLRDITDQQRAKSALDRAYEEMEAHVAERTRDLAEANAQLQSEVAERRRAEEERRVQEAFLRNVIDTAPSFIYIKDADGRFVLANHAVAQAFGVSPQELLGRTDAEFDAGPGTPDLSPYQNLDFAIREDSVDTNVFEEQFTAADGSVRWLQTVRRPIWDESTQTYRTLGISTDITDRKEYEHQIAHQALHDPLTNLPNRALFLDRLNRALNQARRSGGSVALMYIDLDNFKVVNDSLGHEAGDDLIIQLSERLFSETGRIADITDTMARSGSDEFILLVTDPIHATRHVEQTAALIEDQLRKPFFLDGRSVFVTCSIGVVFAGSGDTPQTLIRDADTAMFQAKVNGKARHVYFNPSMGEHAVERLDLETDLRRAVDAGELRLYYQPIVSLRTQTICEVEALIRWEHPTRGLVPPARFIPIAEETGMIVPIGQWVLREACRQAADWNRRFPSEPGLVVGVNLSGRQLHDPDLVSMVSRVLHETQLPPSRLKIEITESAMMQHPDLAVELLSGLRNLGIALAVDDFGTGYSSMAYLSAFPVDTLKIDRFFVSRIGRQADDDIVKAIVTLAKTLNLNVTSEGIETEEQLSHLRSLGCENGQGFFFSRPLTALAMEALLNAASEVPLPESQSRAA